MGILYIQDKRNKRMFIEFIPDEKTGKLYLWNIEEGRLFTLEEIKHLIDLIKKSLDSVNEQEITEINQDIRLSEFEERYLNYIHQNDDYTNHVLSKEYSADQPGYVVCYEDHQQYIHFDCTKKTKNKTLVELLNHLENKNKIKTIHHIYKATEAKKLCAWLDRLFSPGIRRGVILEGSGLKHLEPYEPDFKEYLIQALKEKRHFPRGIVELIVEEST